ncbi:hypothetical protein HYPSUDRAFT_214519 [Hypholoma sublateritium FD-334 SS-4]|uniref:F-box domain-containing protein n=1 Tax=Hypholoma sublateritium (strain FD-334 SS-4) TaxID=945553 RepID=A0A0D2P7N9_HYPSF|nr:hypothetical protein HYPSUDRAFT_214519 [Hypholoma sublateritium FD-334 SS-4]
MATPAKLPLDVLGYIVDIVGTSQSACSNYGLGTLNTLSLTCKFMVPICRRYLFSNLTFSFLHARGRSEFLLSHPIITTHYLKNLVLIVSPYFTIPELEYDLLQIICNSSSLTSITIRAAHGDWREFPERLKPTILALIRVPTLRHLTLDSTNNFPAAALSLCYGLTELTLNDIDNLDPPSADDIMQHPKITALVSSNCSVNTLAVLMGPISQSRVGEANPMIEFDHLRDASFDIETRAEASQICKVLERATCLEKLKILVLQHHVWPVGIGSSLAANPQSKLRYVTLDLGEFNEECGEDILFPLNHELGQLSAKNVLEVLTVEMQVNVDKGSGPITDWMAWATEFDKMLTDIGAFPALREKNGFPNF